MADQQERTWVGLYLPEDAGEPVALFRDAAHVTALMHQHLGRTDGVIVPTDSTEINRDVAAQFESQRPPAAADTAGLDLLRGRVRTRLQQEALEAAIEAEEREAMGLPARPGALHVSAETAEGLGLEPPASRRSRARGAAATAEASGDE